MRIIFTLFFACLVAACQSTQENIPDSPASPIVRIAPAFPAAAARDGVEGWVKLKYDVGSDGKVSNIAVVESQPKRIFDRAAKQAVVKWIYKPATENGKPIKSQVEILLEFKLGV
ncbi:energy transducer TonB [Catenovulum maritimum]|uniref:energy transducer TonB n=1 Tax=Catenovulum maritimum TaxID=1513271 RepID=UPI00069FED11|nr:energy transducer TonB [Catenovulum maritimum]